MRLEGQWNNVIVALPRREQVLMRALTQDAQSQLFFSEVRASRSFHPV